MVNLVNEITVNQDFLEKAQILWKSGLLADPHDLSRVENRWRIYNEVSQKSAKGIISRERK
jgi:hypothetical protein